MNYNDWLGFFFYSKKQKAIRTEHDAPTIFCQTEDGQIRQYTEWVSEGIEPSGAWDDYIALGRGIYHHSQ